MQFNHTWRWILEASPHTGQCKTQTRRLVKPGEIQGFKVYPNRRLNPVFVEEHNREKWEVGKTYAVQPGRTKTAIWWRMTDNGIQIAENVIKYRPSQTEDGTDYDFMTRVDSRDLYRDNGYRELRIRITDIRREDVRNISDDDVRAEGFAHRLDFLSVWCSMNDARITFERDTEHWAGDGTWKYRVDTNRGLADDVVMYNRLAARPAECYDAWKLTFELVKE